MLKVRFGAVRESFEKVGQNKYLLYLPVSEGNNSGEIISGFLSRKFGVPPKKINFAFKDNTGNWVFDVD